MFKSFVFFSLCVLFLTAHGQEFKWHKWADGCYYDIQGNKISGQLRWVNNKAVFGGSQSLQIEYRSSANSKIHEKVTTNNFRSFTIGTDSFVVSHNKDLEKWPILQIYIDKDIKLFISEKIGLVFTGGYSNGYGNNVGEETHSNYYYGKDPDNLTLIDKKNFIEMMSILIPEQTDLVEKIKQKEYLVDNMNEIIDIIDLRREFFRKRNAESQAKPHQ